MVVSNAPAATRQIAITIDDGYCEECVAGYVDFAERTGVSLTLSPNGAFNQIWDRYAPRLHPLIATGQVQMGNHTWSHPDLLRLGDATIRAEIERNEEWLQNTFGVTGRPWFRPPFGRRNSHTDGLAASLGYTKIVLWNATLGDATLETPDVLLGEATRWIKAGAIVLGHANHPTVVHLFDQLQAIIAERRLEPVTLDTMFGTTRATG
ncbi:MAG: polysaccharide deacetylase family protein [Actinomycetota bacterium]|nr:polysaccharide deacetylase family protein [Actinomycetota bacterium]